MSTKVGDTEWYNAVQAAFPQELFIRIYNESVNEPRLQGLFLQISKYVSSLEQRQQQPPVQHPSVPVNPKKRKLEDDSSASVEQKEAVSGKIVDAVTAFECKDVSVQIPARKKLKLSLTTDARDSRRWEVQLINPSTNELEHAIASDEIEDVFSVPVPDKQARQAYFAILPKADAFGVHGGPAEHILFTLNETSPPAVSAHNVAFTEEDTTVSVTQRAFERLLEPYGKTFITPNAAEFASSRQQPHRKGEKAYHVNAHRGSKEGYLYFLSPGILFGFKKPLAFFPFTTIESISYTSVLQRTFNLVIASHVPDLHGQGGGTQETEFSMLDQEDFAGIDEYVKRHGLNDASMAAQRRAKLHNVNKEEVKGEPGANGAVESGDGQSELQKAEQQLQDEEDEEEEDYEASGGESDGEGEYSEEEEEYEGEEYDEEEEGADGDAVDEEDVS